ESGDCSDADAEWPNNILSRCAIVYGSGVIARREQSVRHNVAPSELELCKRLAGEARALMRGVAVGMGSEGDDEFQEVFVAADTDEHVPQCIDERLVQERFGGTIFPLATITIEPLKEEGRWWRWVVDDGTSRSEGNYAGPEDAHEEWLSGYLEDYLRPWRTL